jgi:hypothetical protein
MDNLNNIEERWIDEIIRETEHYYQGEQRQEERASWLLGTVSAILAIVFGSLNLNQNINLENLSNFIIILIISSFFFSTLFSILALIPYKGNRVFPSGILFEENLGIGERNLEEFIKSKFRVKDFSDIGSYTSRLYFHYLCHYQRNFRKSQMVLWASIFLAFGLLISFFMAISIILKI